MTYLPGFENPIGYLVGIRQWRPVGLLLSIVRDHLWKPWEPMTGDINYENSQDGLCTSGVYAAKESHEKVLGGFGCHAVTGKVALWGKIAEHQFGYRAQFGYPISLDHCTDRHVDLDKLRQIYLCPPTEITKAIVEERLQWISERRKENASLSPAQFRQQIQMQAQAQNLQFQRLLQRATQQNISPPRPSMFDQFGNILKTLLAI